MTQSLLAMYENGVLRPLENLQLDGRQQVTVFGSDEHVDWGDTMCLGCIESPTDEPIPLEHVRSALAKTPSSMVDDFVLGRDDPSWCPLTSR